MIIQISKNINKLLSTIPIIPPLKPCICKRDVRLFLINKVNLFHLQENKKYKSLQKREHLYNTIYYINETKSSINVNNCRNIQVIANAR